MASFLVDSVKDVVKTLRSMNLRQFTMQGVNLGATPCGRGRVSACMPATESRARLTFSRRATARLTAPGRLGAAGLIVTSALIIWKSLMLTTGSESPVRACRQPPVPPPRRAARRCPLGPGTRRGRSWWC